MVHFYTLKPLVMNFIAILVAAIVPMIVGAIYYNPKVVGGAWMKASGMTEEKIKTGNMAIIFGVSFLFALMLAIITQVLVIHQIHLDSILLEEPGYGEEGSEIMNYIAAFKENYGDNFRTFKHGAFHGIIAAVFFALPVLGTISLFERRSGKYILIHLVYWVITLAIMGGIISAWT